MSAERAGVHLMETSGAPTNGTSLTTNASAAPSGSHTGGAVCARRLKPLPAFKHAERAKQRTTDTPAPSQNWEPRSPLSPGHTTLEGAGSISLCIKPRMPGTRCSMQSYAQASQHTHTRLQACRSLCAQTTC